ncbi:MAG TPA: hypothetical protein DCG47_12575 [Spirochaetaceae bacterium]|jgi:hypothetical protein|nr:hypothetical protein [Spirochaetaceae bacterium]
MKRFILIAMIALAAAGAWAQGTLGEFQTGFQTFAVDMAATLSYNATVGNNWSDAYIGKLPHFGVGLALGVTAVPVDSLKPLFAEIGDGSIPDVLKKTGMPIPAAALSAKIGGIILPFDIGIKAMILPPEATEALSAQGIAADYKLFGGNIRIGLVKEGLLFPDVSFGAGYNRLTGSMLFSLDVPDQTFYYNDGTERSIVAGDPDINMNWTTDSYDFTLQVSKKLLFLRPFAGLGYSIGKSKVEGGFQATMLYDADGSGVGSTPVAMTPEEWNTIKQQLISAGYDVSALSADGFLVSAENNDPVLRVYGGLSLDLLILSLDLQGVIVPKTKSLGASAMIRVQL